jgi:hypothetical protein
MQLPRCEAKQTARGTGRCQMRVVGPGETLCRFHHPLHRTQTLADLERRKARYWKGYRKAKIIAGQLSMKIAALKLKSL